MQQENMVPVTILTGFLGSGKTTLLNRILKEDHGHRVAVIENEFGEIGVDNDIIESSNEQIVEMNNGCICCTLSSDLVSTLQKLDAGYSPDLVIVEASGAANPSNVLSALPYYRGKPLQSVNTVSILDPLRLQMLIEVMTPLITSQIQYADLVIVNKIDLASPDEVAFACQTAREINHEASVRCANAQQRLEPALISELAPWLI